MNTQRARNVQRPPGGSVGIVAAGWLDRAAMVKPGQKSFVQHGVGFVHRAGPSQSQLLDNTILSRGVETLDTTLGLRAVSSYPTYVQLL